VFFHLAFWRYELVEVPPRSLVSPFPVPSSDISCGVTSNEFLDFSPWSSFFVADQSKKGPDNGLFPFASPFLRRRALNILSRALTLCDAHLQFFCC